MPEIDWKARCEDLERQLRAKSEGTRALYAKAEALALENAATREDIAILRACIDDLAEIEDPVVRKEQAQECVALARIGAGLASWLRVMGEVRAAIGELPPHLPYRVFMGAELVALREAVARADALPRHRHRRPDQPVVPPEEPRPLSG